MNINQKNRFTRLKKVRKLLETYRAEWLNEPAIAIAVEKLDDELSFLENAKGITFKGTKHITSSKKERQAELTDELGWLTGVLYSYAVDNDDKELLTAMEVAPSSVQKLGKEDFISTFQNTVKEATDIGTTGLEPYGVDDSILDHYVSLAADLENILGKTQMTAVELQSLRTAIELRLRVTADMLRLQFKRLMLPFKTRNSGFWNAFKASLVIIDRRSGHGPPEVSVDDVVVN
jgi:hypothetical protein